MKPIVVVGSINMDLVTQTPRIPQAGETVTGSGFQTYSGGKGANQAAAVARLGYPSILLGATGDDAFGDVLRATLSGYGVDTQHIARVAGSSGTASIVVDGAGENTIIVTPGANLHVTPAYLKDKTHLLREASVVLAQLEVPLETVQWLVDCCADLGVPLMLDPAPAAALPDSLMSKVNWFTPNETEARFYAGNGAQHGELAQRLFAHGIRNVILKRSHEGVFIASADGSSCWTNAFPVKAVDSTAAGDAFNAAFAVGLAREFSVEQSARFAAAAAAISVTRHGAQTSLPSGAEVQDFLSKQT